MSFFEKLGSNISNKSKEIAQKAKDMSETNSLNNLIKNEESKINTQYKMIGKLYLEKYKDNPEDCFSPSVELIKKSFEKIAATENQINEIKKRNCCPLCGTSYKNDALFCSKCGNAIPQQTKETEQPPVQNQIEAKKCPQCGEILEKDAIFCCSCGLKLNFCSDSEQSENNNDALKPTDDNADCQIVSDTAQPKSEGDETDKTELNDSRQEDANNSSCPKCDSEIQSGDLFCNECGEKVINE